MNRLLTFAIWALLGLGSCTAQTDTVEFARVENARFVTPHASPYFVGANFWYGALLATEGLYTWDGRLANGTAANMGVYVLYFEAFHPQKGLRKAVKKPVVVSGR